MSEHDLPEHVVAQLREIDARGANRVRGMRIQMSLVFGVIGGMLIWNLIHFGVI